MHLDTQAYTYSSVSTNIPACVKSCGAPMISICTLVLWLLALRPSAAWVFAFVFVFVYAGI